MHCREVCSKYSVKRPLLKEIGRYEDGQKRCSSCTIFFVNLEKKGAVSNFKFPNKLFHESNEDIIWHTNSNDDFRIAEVRLYA